MSYYCDMCLRDIEKKSDSSHLKSKSQKEFEKYKQTILSLKHVDLKDVDEILYLYMKNHDKKINHYLLKGQFKLVFNNNQDCKYIMTGMIDNRTFISWSNYLRDAINNLQEEGYHFNHIAEMDIKTIAHKRDMTYGFYLKHVMPAFEWKLNAMIIKDKNLIKKFPRNWWHPINSKVNCYLKKIIYMEFVKEYVFYNVNIEGVDEINVKHVLIVHMDIFIHKNLFV